MGYYKGQECYITINPWSKQGAECLQYFETKGIIDEVLDRDMCYAYIRKAIIQKVGQKFYTIRYQYSPEGGCWLHGIKINKEEPFYEKDKQFCCLSRTYEEASNKLWEVFEKDSDINV